MILKPQVCSVPQVHSRFSAQSQFVAVDCSAVSAAALWHCALQRFRFTLRSSAKES